MTASRTRRKPRRRELGVTLAEYEALLAAQGGICPGCGNPPKSRRLDVDHDHATGTVRGLLSHRCNRLLQPGVTSATLRRLADYLDDPPAPSVLAQLRGEA